MASHPRDAQVRRGIYVLIHVRPICLIEFWSHACLIKHVKKCQVCNENLLMRSPCRSKNEADQLDMVDKESFARLKSQCLRRHAALKPCVQALGPMIDVVIDPGRSSQHHPLGARYKK